MVGERGEDRDETATTLGGLSQQALHERPEPTITTTGQQRPMAAQP
ncbi:hypothetical protein A2U01_0105071 [Trifolium medium]|uniref:Uncharacterized protein n=1 Tax=Trifolium medium TaxID=97028 RepID=A0A392VAB2_9FABA|nr:hypothetical protein [Trifolium medium]